MGKTAQNPSPESLPATPGVATPGEMEIVDAFTHLIFFGDDEMTAREMGIIRALGMVDDNAASSLAASAYQEIGAYLRALGVNEMIDLVAQVRHHLDQAGLASGQRQSRAGRDQRARL